MEMLQHAHSGLRWVVLALLLGAIINAFAKKGKGEFTPKDKMMAVMALAFTHVQVILGFILYFGKDHFNGLSEMKVASIRFMSLEHPLAMLIGAVLITIGYSKSKRKTENSAKFKTIALWYTIGLILILSRIPWPFMVEGAGWF
jgi:NADH:ubiquinone oxidoreductase subunit 2 (subunit N)